MVAPLTGFETDGNWTTNDQETAFLQTIATDTGAVYSVAGSSELGRPINRLDLGNPSGTTWVIMALTHASERAGREACLAYVRDLAYSTDPADVDYLAACRVVILTPVNPDGLADGGIYNTNGIDINKDHIRLLTAEARVVQAALRDIDAHIALDAHEQSGTKRADIEYFGTATLAVDVAIRDASDAICTAVATAVTGAGHTVGEYPSVGRVSGREAAAYHHCAALLLETHTGDAITDRITYYDTALRAIQGWHAANTALLTDAKAASNANAAANEPRPYILQTGDVVTGGNWPQVPLPETLTGYTVLDPMPTAQLDAYGVVVDGDTVAMAQAARVVVPLLFDPDADGEVAEATRIIPGGAPEQLVARGRLIGLRFGAGGERCRVVRIRHRVDGETREVRMP